MRNAASLLIVVSSLLLIYACSPEASKIIVANYNDESITVEEFEKAYVKNVGDEEKAMQDSLSDYERFLDLYVNFKMKLKDAEVRGYDKSEELQDEMIDYQKNVGVPYFIEKELVDPGVRDLYDRRKNEIRVSHIMIRTDNKPDKEARDLAKSLLKRINAGESFEKLAYENTEHEFSKADSGDIYYITAGQIDPEFESAAYSTPVGSVYSEVLKTRYGYHILKVTEKQPRRYKLQASHILINFVDDNGNLDTAKAYETISKIRDEALAGASFDSLARVYSDDKGSSKKGGDLGFFERRAMVKPFDEAVFNLNVGDLSDIVETKFGYHLIKLEDEKQYPAFESEKENLKKVYKNTTYKTDYIAMLDELAEKYNYLPNPNITAIATNLNDTTKFNSDYWESDFRSKIKDTVVFTIDNNPYVFDSLMSFTINAGKYSEEMVKESAVSKAVNDFREQMLLETKAMLLDDEYPEFASLMNDYKHGILVFKLQEEEVWNKIELDSVKIHRFYEETKDDYKWPDRVQFTELFTKTDTNIVKYQKMYKDGMSLDSLAAKYTERRGMKARNGQFDLMPVGSSPIAKHAYSMKVGTVSYPFEVPGGWVMVRCDVKDPARIKTFEEARPEVTSAFQEMESQRLQEEYLNRLKERYKPVLNYDELENLFTGESE
ncbi:MAG: peptidylprolyl isomerase [Melioribacteraceae bacterium]|nr:peptidylprolyl isomerase [Melioribacteraceae bacterium]MCF8355316.1 peptidylprolyl isomerase [Melioribacteraceae bacterium]MCF8395701.1 peptidylprolyl isomerase [Melioribacteraceae bacterium]MCF8420394.1 peptidylprolyl isomerase [Melioribacteraceae bacterium]